MQTTAGGCDGRQVTKLSHAWSVRMTFTSADDDGSADFCVPKGNTSSATIKVESPVGLSIDRPKGIIRMLS